MTRGDGLGGTDDFAEQFFIRSDDMADQILTPIDLSDPELIDVVAAARKVREYLRAKNYTDIVVDGMMIAALDYEQRRFTQGRAVRSAEDDATMDRDRIAAGHLETCASLDKNNPGAQAGTVLHCNCGWVDRQPL